ncbi:MAG: dTDP-4-dehydrorhamnose 3,5-epimerase family protein [Candidatus Bathyarchaeia archaeon]|jgi:dTDP-4-dehydrorhamnose 3,5-epimerase
MLTGITVNPIKRLPDERGFFSEVMRKDWKEILGQDEVAQANLSVTYPGIVRAWHRHLRGQTDYFLALKGAIKICAFDEKTGELSEVVSTGEILQVVRIPGHYWHGFKALGTEPAMLLYFTTRLYDSVKPDEERRPWNDETLIAKSINDKKDDPRAGKQWDWNFSPNK